MCSLFVSPLWLQNSSLEVVYLFLSQKEWQSSILWRVIYLFWQENLQSSTVWVILPAIVCLFPEKVGSSSAFFQSYHNYFYWTFQRYCIFSNVKICSHPILLRKFLSAYFRTPVTVKQASYPSTLIFRTVSIILKRQQALEAAERFFSEYLDV